MSWYRLDERIDGDGDDVGEAVLGMHDRPFLGGRIDIVSILKSRLTTGGSIRLSLPRIQTID
jgi:hypothetical protein